MSATSGWLYPLATSSRLMFFKFLASSTVGAVMRTISQPARIMRMDWFTVPSVSKVRVVVMDWRRMGLLPPTPTFPTMTSRVFRRV